MALIRKMSLLLSRLLQELRELRARQNGLSLLQRLDLLLAGRLPDLEVLQHEIAAAVQIRILVRQLLELSHYRLLLHLSLHLIALRLRLLLSLIGNVSALRLDAVIRLLHEILVGLLRILLRLDRLGVVDDLLDHAHHASSRTALLVLLEPRGRRGTGGLSSLRERDGLRLLVVEP